MAEVVIGDEKKYTKVRKLFLDDQKWSNMNKKGSNNNEILVRILDFDGFGRKFQKYPMLPSTETKYFLELVGNKIY